MTLPTKYIVWGYHSVYDTHKHIHQGFYKALQHMGKNVQWLDEADDITDIDFSNSFIITNHACLQREGAYWPWPIERKSALPIRDDCFYCVHGMHDNPAVHELFRNHKNNLSWNVLTMRAMRTSLDLPNYSKLTDEIYLDDDVPFSLPQKYMEFRWATDLLPHEIETNKPAEMLSLKNKTINWVGTVWWVNENELSEFRRACESDGIQFNHIGGGQKGVVSSEDNQRLIRESYMAPSISGSHHLTEGYIPCRVFKNISYGQYGVTNNPKTNELFGGKLIFNSDPYKLYFDAKEQLSSKSVKELHALMDFVAQKHTFLNRIAVLEKAAEMIVNDN